MSGRMFIFCFKPFTPMIACEAGGFLADIYYYAAVLWKYLGFVRIELPPPFGFLLKPEVVVPPAADDKGLPN